MYTEKERKAVAGIIRQIAREHHVPETQMRSDMEEAIHAGKNHPDPAVQARWATFRYAGAEPTLEEFILWVATMTKGMTD